MCLLQVHSKRLLQFLKESKYHLAYNIHSAILTIQRNPYYQETTLQNYINTARQYTNDTLVKFPIIKPLIKSAGAAVSIKNSLNLEFTQQTSSGQLVGSNKTTNLTCISKMPTGWNTSNCLQEYSTKLKLFSCEC